MRWMNVSLMPSDGIITVTLWWARMSLKSPRIDGLLNRLFRRRPKKTSKLRVIGLCVCVWGGGGGSSSDQWDSPHKGSVKRKNVSTWWRHHDNLKHKSSWSTLVHVMVCCLTAASHYLNQCWRIVNWTHRNHFSEIVIKMIIIIFYQRNARMFSAKCRSFFRLQYAFTECQCHRWCYRSCRRHLIITITIIIIITNNNNNNFALDIV